tara:strand:+ start:5042 stop:5248 length:207 start_codon:yes stop_codon:yes gene_type:complete
MKLKCKNLDWAREALHDTPALQANKRFSLIFYMITNQSITHEEAVRLMLYAKDFDVEYLTTSTIHKEH